MTWIYCITSILVCIISMFAGLAWGITNPMTPEDAKASRKYAERIGILLLLLAIAVNLWIAVKAGTQT